MKNGNRILTKTKRTGGLTRRKRALMKLAMERTTRVKRGGTIDRICRGYMSG